MQLSLLDYFPDLEKRIFLDVFACTSVEQHSSRIYLKAMEGQGVPTHLKVRCNRQVIAAFPLGTVYKLDMRLVVSKGKKPYFSAISSKKVHRALEFFEHNLNIQKGIAPRKKNRVVFTKSGLAGDVSQIRR